MRARSTPGGTQLICDAGRRELRVPIGMPERGVLAWAFFTYRQEDPLCVEITVRSPSAAPVFERLIPRNDLRAGLRREVGFPTLSVGPAAGKEFVTLVFYEDRIALPVLIPAAALQLFLSSTEDVVPRAREEDVLGLLAARLPLDGHGAELGRAGMEA